MGNMGRNGVNFLKRSFAGIIFVCIVVFTLLSLFLASETEKSVEEVSNIYLTEISRQVQQKFHAVINLRLTQLDGVFRRTPPRTKSNREERLNELKISAEVRGFATLAFLSETGEIETVYGKDVTLIDKEQALGCFKENDRLIAGGYDADGNTMLLMGIKADYEMENGDRSISLLAALPMEYLNEALFLEGNGSGMHFHIIDTDGRMVIDHQEVPEGNYYSYLLSGNSSGDGNAGEKFVRKLENNILEKKEYSFSLSHNGQEKYVFGTLLLEDYDLDWYLISVMPKSVLSDSIADTGSSRTAAILLSLSVITLVMIGVFVTYYKMTMKQLHMLAESRKESERANKAKSEFLSSMSHDIRTPMNAIIGMTEIAMRNTQDAVRMQDCLKKIKLSSKHLLGLINDVLDMSKIESGKMVLNEYPMSLKDLMNDVVNMIQPQVKENNHHFDVFIRNILSENIIADSVRLEQVLINLLSNAVKYTPEGGEIHVYVNQEPSPEGEDYIRTHLRVQDTGIGMSKEFQQRIYNTFAREDGEYGQKVTGTGLGMSITKSIVDLMHGTIELQSEPNQGSEFHVTLDFKKSLVKEEDMRLPEWEILVVDDHEQLCLSAVANLQELGAHAECTMSGADAIQKILERHEKNQDYDFILIDWKMPDMDGVELIRRIRSQIDKRISIFLVSAYAWSDVENELNEQLFEGFIPKPLFKSTLYERLSKYAEGQEEIVEPVHEKKVDFTGKRVLMAEDVDINWEIANEILSSVGLTLEHAENGKECVEMLEKSPIGYYDAVLMDIRMPLMNGYDATKAIRALAREDSKLPIIAMTANAFSNEVQECMDYGMDGYLAKPIDVKECMRVLAQFLL